MAGQVRSFRSLFKRDVCVQCDGRLALACPVCADGEICQFVYPTNTCLQCPMSKCVPGESPSASSTSSPASGGTNVGAIAGGVVGGVLAVAIITYLVWRYCIKTRREAQDLDLWDDKHHLRFESGEYPSFDRPHTNRTSTHTVNSIASTVRTRASNIIQIAYIPGVTNRAAPFSPVVLVPPVPPIPVGVSPVNTTDDQHFFMPGDLRDSTYSADSGFSGQFYDEASYAARSSVASTIYGKNAVIVAPAQTGMRAKPTMVSMKPSSISGTSTPSVPSVDYEKYAPPRPSSRAESAFSVGSTFLNNASAHTATPARAMLVRLPSGSKRYRAEQLKHSESPVSSSNPYSPEPTSPAQTSSTMVDDGASQECPFSDPPDLHHQPSNTKPSAAMRQISGSQVSASSQERGRSPFGDEHATHE